MIPPFAIELALKYGKYIILAILILSIAGAFLQYLWDF